MERLDPDTHFAGAITSTFRFCHSNGIPRGANSGRVVYGRSCGMGWRFGLGFVVELGHVTLSIYFDPYTMDTGFDSMPLTVSVAPCIDEAATECTVLPPDSDDYPKEPDEPKLVDVPKSDTRSKSGRASSTGKTPNVKRAISAPVFSPTPFEDDDSWFHSRISSKRIVRDVGVSDLRRSKTFMSLPTSPIVISTWSSTELVKHPMLRFTVSCEKSSRLSPPSSIPQDYQTVVNEALMHGTFLDVKFWLFSRRARITVPDGDPMTRISHPKPLYANSHLLKSRLGHFKISLSNHGFREATATDLSGVYPEDEDSARAHYDYESDSDLDDDDDTGGEPSTVTEPSVEDDKEDDAVAQGLEPSAGRGQVVVMKATAYRTWHAFIFYLLTGRISFLPLKSSFGGVNVLYAMMIAERLQDCPHEPAPCSPKSMYRLADEVGHEELQRLSLEAIRARLTTKNIVEETFSHFTSRYPAIQEIQISFLRQHYKTTEVAAAFESKMQAALNGELPHALGTLLGLISEFASYESKFALGECQIEGSAASLSPRSAMSANTIPEETQQMRSAEPRVVRRG